MIHRHQNYPTIEMQKLTYRRCLLGDFLNQEPPINTRLELIYLGRNEAISEFAASIIWWHACLAADYFGDNIPNHYFPDNEGILSPGIKEIINRYCIYPAVKERQNGHDVSDEMIDMVAAADARLEEYLEAFDDVSGGDLLPLRDMRAEGMLTGILEQNFISTSSAYVLWCIRKLEQESLRISETIDIITCLLDGSELSQTSSSGVPSGVEFQKDALSKKGGRAKSDIYQLAREEVIRLATLKTYKNNRQAMLAIRADVITFCKMHSIPMTRDIENVGTRILNWMRKADIDHRRNMIVPAKS